MADINREQRPAGSPVPWESPTGLGESIARNLHTGVCNVSTPCRCRSEATASSQGRRGCGVARAAEGADRLTRSFRYDALPASRRGDRAHLPGCQGVLGVSSAPPNRFLSLPQGGGAQRGLGESFSADLHTGTGTFRVPIHVPHGRNGLQPDLALMYAGGDGNGPCGYGWRISQPTQSRKTSGGVPRYDSTDTFVLAGGEDLIRVSEESSGVTRYRPRTDVDFALIERSRAPSDRWVVHEKSGRVSRYATVLRRPGPALAESVFRWHLAKVEDPSTTALRTNTARLGRPARAALVAAVPAPHPLRGLHRRFRRLGYLVSVELLYDDDPDLLDGPSARHDRTRSRTSVRFSRSARVGGAGGS